jgi:NTP pyrophosphatase (non-canonical NTP hydrolase)
MKSTKELVLEWADKKGLLKEENHLKQTLKLTEEVGELSKAILEKNPYDTIDAIGDVLVVITILAKQLNLDIEECYKAAYEEIKDRTGITINGVFYKNK